MTVFDLATTVDATVELTYLGSNTFGGNLIDTLCGAPTSTADPSLGSVYSYSQPTFTLPELTDNVNDVVFDTTNPQTVTISAAPPSFYSAYITAAQDTFSISYVNPCVTEPLTITSSCSNIDLIVGDPETVCTFNVDWNSVYNCGIATVTANIAPLALGSLYTLDLINEEVTFAEMTDGTLDSLFAANPTPSLTLTVVSDTYGTTDSVTINLNYINPCHTADVTLTGLVDQTMTVFAENVVTQTVNVVWSHINGAYTVNEAICGDF